MNLIFGNRGDKFIKNREYNTISLCSSFNSVSSIIGSVTSYITEYFKSKFPANFFKETYISTSMAASAIKKDYFTVKQRPYLFVQPTFDLSPGVMNDLPQTWFDTSWAFLGDLRHNYNMVFQDEENGVRIFNQFRRNKISFKFGIRVNSEIQGWNTIQYIDQNFQTNGVFFLNKVFLNTNIPNYIIRNIARRLNYNLEDALDRERFQQYLLKYSYNGIEAVTDLSTGNLAYIYKYPVNILVHYPDMSNNNKNMRNNIIQNSQVEYNIEAELWVPSLFILEFDNMERFKDLKLSEPDELDDGKYRFSLVINEDYIPYSKDYKNLLIRRNFIPEVNTKHDQVDLKEVIPMEVKKVCEILSENRIPFSKVFLIDLYINGRIVMPENFDVDDKSFILTTYNPLTNTAYTVVMYADMEVLNKINILMDGTEEEKKELKEFIKELKQR